MSKITAGLRSGIKEMTKGRKAGDVLARLAFDPYLRSFRNSSTHVIAPKLEEAAIRSVLEAGHAYVSHHWLRDATECRPRGHVVHAVSGREEVTRWRSGIRKEFRYTAVRTSSSLGMP